MNNIVFSEPKKLQIEDRIVKQMSLATIRSFPDAIVELVTNCDDSYKRIEEIGIECPGLIGIFIERLKGGECKELEVRDNAEGMDKNQLEESLKFGGETSGFEKGKSVRGLFGRGLKETIIALGKGIISTIKDNKMVIAELWWDERDRGAKYRITEEIYNPSTEEGKNIEKGTYVKIVVTNKEIKCPDSKKLVPQICNHFALRDINSSNKREVWINFKSPEKGKRELSRISYEVPEGKEIFSKSVILPHFGDEIIIKIFESDFELDSPYNNPYSKAGLLIKSGGAILDKQLFKFSTEKAGCYFFGEVICNGIYERVKNGDFGLVDPNRTGIEWKHQYCQILQNEIEKILQPLIESKREELSKGKPPAKVSEKTQKMLNKICQLLNKFAKLELEETPDIELKKGEEKEIKDIMIKPPKAYIEVNKERIFSVYIPFKQIGIIPKVKVISSNSEKISVLDPEINNFRSHQKIPLLLIDRFRVIGREVGATGTITATYEESRATAGVNVVPEQKEIKKKRELHIPKGGFFSEVRPDLENDPPQRVAYESGKIKIFVKFPMVQQYLNEKLEPKVNEGKVILAELMGEVFCRFTARKKVDRGDYPIIPGAEIDTFNRALNDMQKEYLHKIHEVILIEK